MAGMTYAGIVVMLLLLENRLLFHPVRAASDWQAPPLASVQDVTLELPDGTTAHAWWLPHPQPRGALLYCHGNAGNLSHRGPMMAEWHRRMHYSVLIFDYPGYGKSTGSPSEAGCYASGEEAYQWLTTEGGMAPDQIVLYGGSLGGGVAVDLASRHPHRALVLIAAFTSVPDMAQKLYPWLPARWLVRSQFNNLAKISQSKGPVFIAHGDADRLIPIEHGRKLFEAARAPKHFHVLQGHSHDEGADDDFFAAFRQFLGVAAATSN
jgi:hypothetical protein